MPKPKKAYWFEDVGKCPNCGKRFKLGIKREVVSPASKAIVQTVLVLEKDDQTELVGRTQN